MQSQNLASPAISVLPLTDNKITGHRAECRNSTKATGEVDMEPRVTELETHLKSIRRDMEEARDDVKSIKHRLAYSAGGTVVILGLLGWIANSRFEQVISLLLAH
ncbi:hypothetical protein [Pseudomonas baetica]|uniref:hypothetical protein n=1 Tax=Pseudomonas baetica TaxID=674054 RepID=UPI002406D7BD|nr:hypothetical protein [Pseudomonas baetica]MDF9774357.1 hypothetical protein [Pseudomonas baetica]